MFASYLIIAAVLTLIAGHLTLVNYMFMRSEPRVASPRRISLGLCRENYSSPLSCRFDFHRWALA